MKKSLFAFAVACMIAACGAGSANAQELAKNATPAQIAAFEAENFLSFDDMNADGPAKFAQKVIDATDEGAEGSDAKCWFWGWRYYSYPTYYYYTWYCPCYYVPLRLVTYTVPTVTVSTNVNTVVVAKSSGKTACGAVVDQTVPANSPLAAMGIKAGDVITHVDGRPVKSNVDLRRITANSKLKFIPGDQISVSKKQINHVPNESEAKAIESGAKGLTALNIGEKSIGENETVTLYEYYEALEKNAK